jgi:tetratricopeptide (TPR) repeat protein
MPGDRVDEMRMESDPVETGVSAFDEARALLAAGHREEALDLFEVGFAQAADPAVRASAAAHVAAILLERDALAEARGWVVSVRIHPDANGVADLLEGSLLVREGRYDEACDVLEGAATSSDPWFEVTPYARELVLAHARYLLGDADGARAAVERAVADAPGDPDVWNAVARLGADGVLDPAMLVADVDPEHLAGVLAGLDGAEPAGAALVAEALWSSEPGDPRLLGWVATAGRHLPLEDCVRWAARLRAAGLGDRCCLVARARERTLPAPDRVQAAVAALVAFGDETVRDALEVAVPSVADDEIADVLEAVQEAAPVLADSVVVAGATTASRCLRIARVLARSGHVGEAYAVLRHGLSLESADRLGAAEFAAMLPPTAREQIRAHALAGGDADVVAVLDRLDAEAPA